MNKSIRKVAALFSASAVLVGIVLSGESSSWAQQRSGNLKQQIVGGWMLVSAVVERDGSKREPWTSNPLGFLSFDQDGNCSVVSLRPDMPKIASNNPRATTADENRAIAQGLLVFFGKYTVNEKDGSVNITIRGSSFPNWVGSEQERFITVTGDDMRFVGTSPGGGKATLIYKRAK